MAKKSINEIVNNENYKNLNEALIDRSIEIAGIIRNEMNKLQISEIGNYKICEVKSHSGFSEEYLGMLEDNVHGYTSLERTKSCYYTGDYNCWIEAATTRDRIQFLNAARSIFDAIDEIKENRCAEINFVLSETENFIKKVY